MCVLCDVLLIRRRGKAREREREREREKLYEYYSSSYCVCTQTGRFRRAWQKEFANTQAANNSRTRFYSLGIETSISVVLLRTITVTKQNFTADISRVERERETAEAGTCTKRREPPAPCEICPIVAHVLFVVETPSLSLPLSPSLSFSLLFEWV